MVNCGCGDFTTECLLQSLPSDYAELTALKTCTNISIITVGVWRGLIVNVGGGNIYRSLSAVDISLCTGYSKCRLFS